MPRSQFLVTLLTEGFNLHSCIAFIFRCTFHMLVSSSSKSSWPWPLPQGCLQRKWSHPKIKRKKEHEIIHSRAVYACENFWSLMESRLLWGWGSWGYIFLVLPKWKSWQVEDYNGSFIMLPTQYVGKLYDCCCCCCKGLFPVHVAAEQASEVRVAKQIKSHCFLKNEEIKRNLGMSLLLAHSQALVFHWLGSVNHFTCLICT